MVITLQGDNNGKYRELLAGQPIAPSGCHSGSFFGMYRATVCQLL